MVSSRRITWVLGLLLGQAALLWATYPIPGLGDATWHHVASLIFTVLVAAVLWRPLSRSKRFLAMGVFAFTILATASGFWLLYWKEGLRIDGLQDWGRFWHVLWSWFAFVFFFQHTWVNRVAYWSFVRRTVAHPSGAVLHFGAYALVLAAFFVTWSTTGREWFTNDNYIPLTLYTWLLVAVPPYVIWLYVQTRLGFPLSRVRTLRLFARRRVRVWFTVGLVPIAALALISGIPLVFMKGIVENDGLKYVSKYWHVWPSALFAILVFGHAVHSWRAVKAHWRSYGVTLGDVPDPRVPVILPGVAPLSMEDADTETAPRRTGPEAPNAGRPMK